MPLTTKKTVTRKPACVNVRPKSFMSHGKSGGITSCEKCEHACATPTSPMTSASWRSETGCWTAAMRPRSSRKGVSMANGRAPKLRSRRSDGIIADCSIEDAMAMRRNRFISRARHNADAETLAKLARRLSESGSRIEDQLWERRLVELLNDRLTRGFDADIEAALDDLSRSNARAYDDLADLAESCSESATIEIDGKAHDALLVAVPLLAWSRYKLPASSLASALVDNLAVQIVGHLAARGTRIAVADYLFSIDQLPESFGEVHDLAHKLFACAAQGTRMKIDAKSLREPVAMLADTRYLLSAIVVPQGQALYHWQEIGVDADAKLSAVEAFCGQLANVIQPLMTGCRFKALAPNAFHAALRVADRELRGFSLEAAVAYLKLAYDLAPAGLQATIAAYEDKRIEEMRVGIGN